MSVRLRHFLVVASLVVTPLALFAGAGCTEKFEAEDLPGRVVALGPAAFDDGALSVRVLTYDQEGDSLTLMPEFATSGGFGAIASDQILTPLVLPETGPRETLSSVVVWQVPDELAGSTLQLRIRIDGQTAESPVLGPLTPTSLSATLPEVPVDLDASMPDVDEDASEADGSGNDAGDDIEEDAEVEDTSDDIQDDAAEDIQDDAAEDIQDDAAEDIQDDAAEDIQEDAEVGDTSDDVPTDVMEDTDNDATDGSGDADGSGETDGSGEGRGER